MVLINNQATCLSCGATPSPNVEPPEREEHHYHHHAGHVHEETKAEPDDLTKLRILLPHWIEHNEEHAASFERWGARARALRRGKTAQRIEDAVERMADCNQALRAALEALEG